ncbi:hypothetical protein H8356DRAFT_1301008 [Neocallimastix lanati (nom. inval.)]|nr:hypothetical protein H8356DRAFT_1301008 [Neocallimastix sp. JGI-2020a]
MKNEIRKTSIPFDINPKHIYNEISEEIGLICIEYKQATYELSFEELKKNASKYNNNIIVTPKILHCDFEKGISNAAIKIFPNITIKYCFIIKEYYIKTTSLYLFHAIQ